MLGLLVSALAGCSDPSDKVTKSAASAPKAADAADAAAAAAAGGSASGSGRTYKIGGGSKIGFIGSKVTGSHHGGFTNVTGTLSVAEGKITGNPEIVIDMSSTWADNPKLTGHLISPDFFNVAAFPTSKFVMTSVEAGKVTGNLTLHGVTKSIAFPATLQVGDDAVTMKAEFAINRKDFNITYPGKPDDLIRDNVVIKFDIKAMP